MRMISKFPIFIIDLNANAVDLDGAQIVGRIDMTRLNALFLALISTALATPLFASDDRLVRTDRFVTLAGGDRLFVREVRPAEQQQAVSAVLLIHGARVPSLASFDLAVPGGSIAAELAAEGHSVYLLDLRGYGASSRPLEMDAPPGGGTPLMRTDEAVSDVAAAVEAVAEWSGDGKVSILGWATGGQWAAAFAARHPGRVERIILYNSLYGASDRHPTLGRGSPLEAPDRPGSLNMDALGAYRLNTAESLFAAWDKSIPVPDKSEWRDPAVARAYADMALSSDPTSARRTPPSFRAPSGAMADSFELAFGRKQWNAAALTMPVLVIRSQRDFWSRPEDAAAIAREAPQASLVELSDATHFVHLDRNEAGRSAFLSAVIQFLLPGLDHATR